MKTMITERTGRTTSTGSFDRELGYLGNTNTPAHINDNGVTKRDIMVGSIGVRIDSLQHTHDDFMRLFKKRPDLSTKTIEFVVSPQKGTVNANNPAQVKDFMRFNLALDRQAFPNHLAYDCEQNDSTHAILHCHHMISSQSTVAPYHVLRGNDYSQYHFAYVANQVAKRFNKQNYSIKLGTPLRLLYHQMNNQITPQMNKFISASAPIMTKLDNHQLGTNQFIHLMHDDAHVNVHIASSRRRKRDAKGHVVYLKQGNHYLYHKNNHGNRTKVPVYVNEPRISYLPITSTHHQSASYKRAKSNYFTPRVLAKVNPSFKNEHVTKILREVDKQRSQGKYINTNIMNLANFYRYHLTHDEQEYFKSNLIVGSFTGDIKHRNLKPTKQYLKKTGQYLNQDERKHVVNVINKHLVKRADFTDMGKQLNIPHIQQLAKKALKIHNFSTYMTHGALMYHTLSKPAKKYFADNMRGIKFGNKSLLHIKQTNIKHLTKYSKYLKSRLDNDVKNQYKNKHGAIKKLGLPISSTDKNKVDNFFASHYLRSKSNSKKMVHKFIPVIKHDKQVMYQNYVQQVADNQTKGLKLYKHLSNPAKRYFRANLSGMKFGNLNLIHVKSTPINQLKGYDKILATNLYNSFENQFKNKKGKLIKMGKPASNSEKHLIDKYFSSKLFIKAKHSQNLKKMIFKQVKIDRHHRQVIQKQRIENAVNYAKDTIKMLDRPGWKYFKANLKMSKYGANYLNHVKFTPAYKLTDTEKHTKSYLHSVLTGTFTTKDGKVISNGREVNKVEKQHIDNVFRYKPLQTSKGMHSFRKPVVKSVKTHDEIEKQQNQKEVQQLKQSPVFARRLQTGSLLYNSLSNTGKAYMNAKIHLGEKDLGWLHKVENANVHTNDTKQARKQLSNIAKGYGFMQLKNGVPDKNAKINRVLHPLKYEKPKNNKLSNKEKNVINMYLHGNATQELMKHQALKPYIKAHKTPFVKMTASDFKYIHAYNFGTHIANTINRINDIKLKHRIEREVKHDDYHNLAPVQPTNTVQITPRNNVDKLMNGLSSTTAKQSLYVRAKQVIPNMWNNKDFGRNLSLINTKYGIKDNKHDLDIFTKYQKDFNKRVVNATFKQLKNPEIAKTRSKLDEVRIVARKLNEEDSKKMLTYLKRIQADKIANQNFAGQMVTVPVTQSNIVKASGNKYSVHDPARIKWVNRAYHDIAYSGNADFSDNKINIPNATIIHSKVQEYKASQKGKAMADTYTKNHPVQIQSKSPKQINKQYTKISIN